MPETLMDWATLIGTVCALIGLVFLFIRRSSGSKTKNTIVGGSRNVQRGGDNDVENSISSGDDNQQSG